MKSSKIPHDDYREGFIVGYQLIRGTTVAVPGNYEPYAPYADSSYFLDGIKAGIEAAGGSLIKGR